MKIFGLENAQEYSIVLKGSSGDEMSICPACSSSRKKKTDKSFSWNHDKKVGQCHHCGEKFVIEHKKNKVEYVRPEWVNNTTLSKGAVKWFEGRGISQFTLRKMQITEGVEYMPQRNAEVNTIQFNFFRDGELVNIKYRDGAKNFKMFKGAETIPYNIDSIHESAEVIIVEGEVDALTLWECGFHHTISVPNGANNLDWLNEFIDYFDDKTKIILATDQDVPGVKMRTELSKRLGVHRCYKVDLGDQKDPNEVLTARGKEDLINAINTATPFPVEGVFSLKDTKLELDGLFTHGLQPGKKIGIPSLDDLISYETSRLYTISGIPGHGKSEVLDFILCKLNVMHGWKVAYFSPENFPIEWHVSKIIEKIGGVKFSREKMSEDMYRHLCDYVNDNFFFIYPKDGFTIDNILEKAEYLVRRKGIRAFVIDPYNKLEHKMRSGQAETNYISELLDKVIRFTQINDLATFLVAHPRKMGKDNKQYDVPTLYDISGSSHFYNKTDYGITVYRDFEGNFLTVYIQKVKFKHLGETGYTNFLYNVNNGRIDAWKQDSDRSLVQWDNDSWIDINKSKPEPPDPDRFIEPNKLFEEGPPAPF